MSSLLRRLFPLAVCVDCSSSQHDLGLPGPVGLPSFFNAKNFVVGVQYSTAVWLYHLYHQAGQTQSLLKLYVEPVTCEHLTRTWPSSQI